MMPLVLKRTAALIHVTGTHLFTASLALSRSRTPNPTISSARPLHLVNC